MTVIHTDLLEGTGVVRCAASTRKGGVSPEPFGMNMSFRVGDDPASVAENRRRFLEQIGATPAELAFPVQVHSATVRRADTPGEYPACDALVSDVEGLTLAVSVADCVPILLVDPVRRAIAAVHAGWRGTTAGMAGAAVRAMVGEFGCEPARMFGWIGPSASACCYRVGEDVAALFPQSTVDRRVDGPYVDLKAANLHQLVTAGLMPEHVEVSPLCTITENDLLHSFRRDGARSGRMMAAIRLVAGAR